VAEPHAAAHAPARSAVGCDASVFLVECGGVPGATATRMNSSEFKATLIEVRKISDDRTYEQLRIAQY